MRNMFYYEFYLPTMVIQGQGSGTGMERVQFRCFQSKEERLFECLHAIC